MRRFASMVLASVASIALASGCGEPSNSGSGECVADLDPSACSPLYSPTFDDVYTRTLAKTCALSGGACHAAEGDAGGLSFESADAAYEHLTGGTKPRVIAGDAACSLITVRIEAKDDRIMPPGSPLSEAERCAIEQWIENGATR